MIRSITGRTQVKKKIPFGSGVRALVARRLASSSADGLSSLESDKPSPGFGFDVAKLEELVKGVEPISDAVNAFGHILCACPKPDPGPAPMPPPPVVNNTPCQYGVQWRWGHHALTYGVPENPPAAAAAPAPAAAG